MNKDKNDSVPHIKNTIKRTLWSITLRFRNRVSSVNNGYHKSHKSV